MHLVLPQLDHRAHISHKHFQETNWLPTDKWINQALKFLNVRHKYLSFFTNEVYQITPQKNISNNTLKLKQPF